MIGSNKQFFVFTLIAFGLIIICSFLYSKYSKQKGIHTRVKAIERKLFYCIYDYLNEYGELPAEKYVIDYYFNSNPSYTDIEIIFTKRKSYDQNDKDFFLIVIDKNNNISFYEFITPSDLKNNTVCKFKKSNKSVKKSMFEEKTLRIPITFQLFRLESEKDA